MGITIVSRPADIAAWQAGQAAGGDHLEAELEASADTPSIDLPPLPQPSRPDNPHPPGDPRRAAWFAGWAAGHGTPHPHDHKERE